MQSRQCQHRSESEPREADSPRLAGAPARFGVHCAWSLALALIAACSGEAHDIGDEDGAVVATASNANGGASTSGAVTAGTTASGGSSAVMSTGTSTTSSGTGTVTSDPLSGEACAGFPVIEGAAGADGGGCAGTGDEVEALDVDMYIMVDKTSSMLNTAEAGGATRWQVVTDALKEFVNQSGLENIGVGLQFFSWNGEADCDPTRYATPAVGIGPASEVASDIVAAIDAQSPIGQTPTAAALTGAVTYAKQWARTHLGRQTVVVLVTDGYPTQCDPQDIVDVAQIAADSFGQEPQVPVYVVGIDGIYSLDQIARQGGTHAAFNVASGGTAEKLVQTLSNIGSSELNCEYNLPEPPSMMALDLERVRMVYTPGSGEAQEVPYSPNGYASCANSEHGGWYYAGRDEFGNPNKIVVCPCTCASFRAGKVEVVVDCRPAYVLE